MAWYQLTTDVMVQGTPRSSGEVLDLSVSDGQLLIGLQRAVACDPPQPPPEPVCHLPTAVKPPVKPVVRRRTSSPTPED